MTLRVIAGQWRGRKLLAPPGLETRPMPDRIKQSLFDWLGPIDGAQVADVCAGSGTLGCEALSRGAAMVHLIEPGRHAQGALRANARSLGDPAGLRLHPRPFQAVLPGLRGLDLILADPPFPWFTDEPATLQELLTLARTCLAAKGRLFLRGERGSELSELPTGLRQEERRFYGRSWVARYTALAAPREPASIGTVPVGRPS